MIADFVGCDNSIPRENTAARCENGQDDDDDGRVDCDDQDCWETAPCASPDADADGDSDSDDTDADIDQDADDDSGLTCDDRCDCPAGTVCNIEGRCEGDPCTQPCRGPEDCDCDQPCIEGFCAPLWGRSGPCAHHCDCHDGEYCAGGQCVRTCAFNRWRCEDDGDCAPCDQHCSPFGATCLDEGACEGTNLDCRSYGPQVCVSNVCVEPPGTQYPADIIQDIDDTNRLVATFEVPEGVTIDSGMNILLDLTDTTGGWGAFFEFYLQRPSEELVSFSFPVSGMYLSDGNGRVAYPLTTDNPHLFDIYSGDSASGQWTLHASCLAEESCSGTINTLILFIP